MVRGEPEKQGEGARGDGDVLASVGADKEKAGPRAWGGKDGLLEHAWGGGGAREELLLVMVVGGDEASGRRSASGAGSSARRREESKGAMGGLWLGGSMDW